MIIVVAIIIANFEWFIAIIIKINDDIMIKY